MRRWEGLAHPIVSVGHMGGVQVTLVYMWMQVLMQVQELRYISVPSWHGAMIHETIYEKGGPGKWRYRRCSYLEVILCILIAVHRNSRT
jgi:hypothetical protein